MYNKKYFNQFFLVLILIYGLGCRGKIISQNNDNHIIVNCLILKPITQNCDCVWPVIKKESDIKIEDLLIMLDTKTSIQFDSLEQFTACYDYQKQVLINPHCFDKLTIPDSSNLMEIYLSSRTSTLSYRHSKVEFIKSYEKNIFNFGMSRVYEYVFNDVSQVEPHNMQIIIKNIGSNNGEDYEGFVICSDGILWREVQGTSSSIFSHLKAFRGNKGSEIPMYFDKGRFIPIGHYQIDSWNTAVKN